ncbi:recombinase family protein [Parafrankia discariae]|uniref:recombinase family protein n=1 Tax=Parafrankia discariae TaxID=365528 RepID=UPI001E5D1A0C|nr:recombinase family protein [Parafrankia discariae]
MFLGRVSDEDLQDPTLSLPRQVASCQAVLPPGGRIVAFYWDIESGRLDPDRRGNRKIHEKFSVPIPRDGGIKDLLVAASKPDRVFDGVICEAVDRVARRTYYGVKIEHDLEKMGIQLLAADEGISNLRKRATAILTRRVKQATAEWYVLETLEKAWDGFCEHATQGWNIGVPPYGYLADSVPHPVPAKRADGLKKTRLQIDPVRAHVIETMFLWRTSERLSVQRISNRLDEDHDLYPPPVAVGGRRSRGSWSHRTVADILENPKYTGYMVWNRRARASANGKRNPPELWVWSPKPTHVPIISLETYRAASEIAKVRKGSRSGPRVNRHPAAVNEYLMRSYIRCAICQRRMEPDIRKGQYIYFRCRIRGRESDELRTRWPQHPANIYVPQQPIIEAVLDFFADRVFGRDRYHLLSAAVRESEDLERSNWKAKITNLEESLEDLDRRRARLIRTLETVDDLDEDLIKDVNRRSVEISRDRKQKKEDLARLRGTSPMSTGRDAALLDQLGTIGRRELARAPDPLLRALFDVCQLEITYDVSAHLFTCAVQLDEGNMQAIGGVSDAMGITKNPAGGLPAGLGMLDVRSEGLEPPTS